VALDEKKVGDLADGAAVLTVTSHAATPVLKRSVDILYASTVLLVLIRLMVQCRQV
jgi:hypothetical protein